VNAKVVALVFGAFLFLVAVPAMGLYSQAISGIKPVDYNLWVVLYFVYALVVLVSGSRR